MNSTRDMLFRYHDRNSLDVSLNATATVDDVSVYLGEYARRSEVARQNVKCELSIQYDDALDAWLDVFMPEQAGENRPVVIYYHGGFWRAVSARESAFMAECLTKAGICVVAVNFGLAPACTMDEIVRQCRSAAGWTRKNIRQYGGDPESIHLCGSSAGAHLAAAVGSQNWSEEKGAGDFVRSMTLYSGIYDLEPVLLGYPNDWLLMDNAMARRNSPIRHLPRPGMQIAIGYGETEAQEFIRQSEAYIAAATAAGCDCRFVAEPGTNHFDSILRLAEPNSNLTRALLRMVAGN